jgi:regulator of nucleoside diphosphate kinase
MTTRIMLSTPDVRRLRGILAAAGRHSHRDREHLADLLDEIERARVVALEKIPADVVTLDSAVTVRDVATGECGDYVLVSPSEADVAAGRISVLAPLGTALLGYRAGAEIEWQMPGRIRRFKIDRVVQPQSAALPENTAARSAFPGATVAA